MLLMSMTDMGPVGFDGQKVWALPRCHRAITRQYQIIDMSRRSMSYEYRLLKYSKRSPGYITLAMGQVTLLTHVRYAVVIPELNHTLLDNAILQKQVGAVTGLARLLLLFFDNDRFTMSASHGTLPYNVIRNRPPELTRFALSTLETGITKCCMVKCL